VGGKKISSQHQLTQSIDIQDQQVESIEQSLTNHTHVNVQEKLSVPIRITTAMSGV